MPYIITAPCADSKNGSCVDVCPVDCIHPAPDEPDFATAKQLYINPAECIECDACRTMCPVDAIFAHDTVPADMRDFIQINVNHYQIQ